MHVQDPNAVVSTVIRIEPPLDRPPAEALRAEGGLSVELKEGRRVRLDPDDPRSAGFAQILDGLSKQRLPVYLEIDPETSAITRLLIPHVTRVVGIRPIDKGVLAVELELSHARHVLRHGAPAEPVGPAGAASLRELPVAQLGVQGGGFEPPKAEPAGLQPAPFGHSGIPASAVSVAPLVPGAGRGRGP